MRRLKTICVIIFIVAASRCHSQFIAPQILEDPLLLTYLYQKIHLDREVYLSFELSQLKENYKNNRSEELKEGLQRLRKHRHLFEESPLLPPGSSLLEPNESRRALVADAKYLNMRKQLLTFLDKKEASLEDLKPVLQSPKIETVSKYLKEMPSLSLEDLLSNLDQGVELLKEVSSGLQAQASKKDELYRAEAVRTLKEFWDEFYLSQKESTLKPEQLQELERHKKIIEEEQNYQAILEAFRDFLQRQNLSTILSNLSPSSTVPSPLTLKEAMQSWLTRNKMLKTIDEALMEHAPLDEQDFAPVYPTALMRDKVSLLNEKNSPLIIIKVLRQAMFLTYTFSNADTVSGADRGNMNFGIGLFNHHTHARPLILASLNMQALMASYHIYLGVRELYYQANHGQLFNSRNLNALNKITKGITHSIGSLLSLAQSFLYTPSMGLLQITGGCTLVGKAASILNTSLNTYGVISMLRDAPLMLEFLEEQKAGVTTHEAVYLSRVIREVKKTQQTAKIALASNALGSISLLASLGPFVLKGVALKSMLLVVNGSHIPTNIFDLTSFIRKMRNRFIDYKRDQRAKQHLALYQSLRSLPQQTDPPTVHCPSPPQFKEELEKFILCKGGNDTAEALLREKMKRDDDFKKALEGLRATLESAPLKKSIKHELIKYFQTEGELKQKFKEQQILAEFDLIKRDLDYRVIKNMVEKHLTSVKRFDSEYVKALTPYYSISLFFQGKKTFQDDDLKVVNLDIVLTDEDLPKTKRALFEYLKENFMKVREEWKIKKGRHARWRALKAH